MASARGSKATFFDQFMQACGSLREYPFTLQNPSLSDDIHEEYHQLLVQHSPTLFDESRSRIILWELWNGNHEFSSEVEVDTELELSEHLQEHCETKLKCRHVFINSWSSRHALDCSEDLLKALFTFHQVDPFFLDDLVTFGKQSSPLDACLSRFTDHNAYKMSHRLLPVPLLGRSGHEIRHSFLLRSAERAEPGDNDPWPWRIRPCAAYHSFDLVTGRTLWVTTKSNDLIQKKIMANVSTLPAFSHPEDPATSDTSNVGVLDSFEAALDTHLVYFHWCERSWRWFIRDIDQYIEKKLRKAREFPVNRHEKLPVRVGTSLSSSAKSTFSQSQHQQSKGGFLGSLLQHRLFGRPPITDPEPPVEMAAYTDEAREEAGRYGLGQVNFDDLQALGAIYRRLEEGNRVCKLNRQVLRNISDHYNNISQYHPNDMNGGTEKAMRKSIWRFALKVESIIKSFETSETQLTSVRTILAETDKSLVENIIQLRGAHTSRVFAEAAHNMADDTRDIADRTANISHSAYIIGFIAFFLLCATFPIGLLQSPIFQCNQDEQRAGKCSFYGGIFRLFIEISVPMTLIVLGFFWYLKARSRKTQLDVYSPRR